MMCSNTYNPSLLWSHRAIISTRPRFVLKDMGGNGKMLAKYGDEDDKQVKISTALPISAQESVQLSAPAQPKTLLLYSRFNIRCIASRCTLGAATGSQDEVNPTTLQGDALDSPEGLATALSLSDVKRE